ncbi:MAG: hypothetical protein DBW62_00655 [Microbacterium sp.]|nr:MAG: hypothetical protein DBW62_00655 [Microbacterium sp.]
MSKLNATTVVRDKRGRSHVFGPDSDIPAWAETAITNRDLWEIPPEPAVAVPDTQKTIQPGTGSHPAGDPPKDPEDQEPGQGDNTAAPALSGGADDGTQPQLPELLIPPKHGAGSSTDAWRDYAREATGRAGLNIEISDDASRGDIIDALAAAGIPTEPKE